MLMILLRVDPDLSHKYHTTHRHKHYTTSSETTRLFPFIFIRVGQIREENLGAPRAVIEMVQNMSSDITVAV